MRRKVIAAWMETRGFIRCDQDAAPCAGFFVDFVCLECTTHHMCGLHCPTRCIGSSSSKLGRAPVSGIAVKHRLSVVSPVLEYNIRGVVLVDGQPAANLHCWPACTMAMLIGLACRVASSVLKHWEHTGVSYMLLLFLHSAAQHAQL